MKKSIIRSIILFNLFFTHLNIIASHVRQPRISIAQQIKMREAKHREAEKQKLIQQQKIAAKIAAKQREQAAIVDLFATLPDSDLAPLQEDETHYQKVQIATNIFNQINQKIEALNKLIKHHQDAILRYSQLIDFYTAQNTEPTSVARWKTLVVNLYKDTYLQIINFFKDYYSNSQIFIGISQDNNGRKFLQINPILKPQTTQVAKQLAQVINIWLELDLLEKNSPVRGLSTLYGFSSKYWQQLTLEAGFAQPAELSKQIFHNYSSAFTSIQTFIEHYPTLSTTLISTLGIGTVITVTIIFIMYPELANTSYQFAQSYLAEKLNIEFPNSLYQLAMQTILPLWGLYTKGSELQTTIQSQVAHPLNLPQAVEQSNDLQQIPAFFDLVQQLLAQQEQRLSPPGKETYHSRSSTPATEAYSSRSPSPVETIPQVLSTHSLEDYDSKINDIFKPKSDIESDASPARNTAQAGNQQLATNTLGRLSNKKIKTHQKKTKHKKVKNLRYI